MPSLALLAASAVSLAIIILSIALVRFNLKRRAITRAAATASASQLDTIYRLVERTGTVAANGYILARSNETSEDERCLIPLPAGLPGFPWAGTCVEITATNEVAFRFSDATPAGPILLGKRCRPVPVPRHRAGASGKARNVLAPERYLAASPALTAALAELCPAWPAELLSHLLCIGSAGFEFDPLGQARIGTSPSWAQTPEQPGCGVCGKRMALILQLPGTTIGKQRLHEGSFYFFGCTRHPDQTSSLAQYT